MPKAPVILKKEDEKEVIQALCSLIEARSEAALSASATARFHLGLSGGSLAKFLISGLSTIKTDWARWRLFFCDERLVPVEDGDSTWGLYRSGLCGLTPLKEEQFLVVNTDLDPASAASDYQARLVEALGPALRLDMLLLGMGPDGHTCSLFPGHALLSEPEPSAGGRIVAPITDSPKPPPCRVTLTLPAVNSAACCVFACVGQSKADMVNRILGIKEDFPATRVQPREPGEVVWILDKGAASGLA